MKTIDKDGLLLCELQGKTFEQSVKKTDVSSPIFVRRYMNSQAAKWLDTETVLASNILPEDLLEMIEEQYGTSEYGSVKYTQNEMFWIGYVYRYFAYTYERSSASIYRLIKPKELRDLFLPYHTLDPAQAIERILEAKGQATNPEDDIQRHYRIFRKNREKSNLPPYKNSERLLP